MTVYVIRDDEGKMLEICANLGAAYAWIDGEIEDSFRVVRYDDGFRVVTKNGEVYVVTEWQVIH